MKKRPIENRFVVLLMFSVFILIHSGCGTAPERIRQVEKFTKNWQFHLGDVESAQAPSFADSSWRTLNLPHDWSIEGEFSKDHPATVGGGALPGGIGWYRKSFALPKSEKGKKFFIDFDGVYQDSEVWINGHSLGKRPNGYISFRYDLTPHLQFGEQENVLAVRVDNSLQPNSRWYSGSGIYRNVWLVSTAKVYVDQWGTYVTTPEISNEKARVALTTRLKNDATAEAAVTLRTQLVDKTGAKITEAVSRRMIAPGADAIFEQNLLVDNPQLWSTEYPYLYTIKSIVELAEVQIDDYETTLGIRTFNFDAEKGFSLNGKPMKILGVCQHHDLGALGAAVNKRAIERQLQILKEMGCNSIRTAHNPPAPELLELCDEMGILVQDEMFDMWKKNKSAHDYAQHWDKWYEKDLKDFIRRDRNHPSIITWSIGNEILEQWDSTGTAMTKKLAGIVRQLDDTRPITAACNDPKPHNNIIKSGALDLIGYNYNHNDYAKFPELYPDGKFIATETTSSLMTRGAYDMPSDSIRIWPVQWDKPVPGNPDHTCSAYDNCRTGWGSTHEEVWNIIKKHDFLSGMYVWTGFDYLGEPTPYSWPARSSYFGIIDLAGFPKDVYYMYQSEWTDKDVLHVFPHWNWQDGQTVDVKVYTSFPEVELLLNGTSLGSKKKLPEDLHLMWRVTYEPGEIKAIATKEDGTTLEKVVKTAGAPANIALSADRSMLHADGEDVSFITVDILDENDTLVPDADNLLLFSVSGPAEIIAVDNGLQTSHEPFKANRRKAFNGKCLAIVQTKEIAGEIVFTARADGLGDASVTLHSKK